MFWGKRASAHRPSRVTIVLAWSLVAFYLVASGRAFLPGLCATQNAMDAQGEGPSCTVSMSVMRSCCARGANRDDGPTAPVPSSNTECAFCKLLHSVVPLPLHVTLPPLSVFAFGAPVARSTQLQQDGVLGAVPTRAPPGSV